MEYECSMFMASSLTSLRSIFLLSYQREETLPHADHSRHLSTTHRACCVILLSDAPYASFLSLFEHRFQEGSHAFLSPDVF